MFFFYHVAKEARKSRRRRRRRRRRIRTEQNSPMGFRPLDESAPSARKSSFTLLGMTKSKSQISVFSL